MSFECLQNALCRDLQAAEQSVYDRRSLSCRYQHVRLQGLKRKCFPHAQSAETIRNRERFDRKMGKNIVHKDMRFVPAPCSPAILHPCDPAPLRPYTLHLTPYTLRFHFSTSPFRPFGLSQSSKQHPQKTKLGLTQKRITVRRAHQENGLRSFFKELNLICAANKKPPCYLFSDKY